MMDFKQIEIKIISLIQQVESFLPSESINDAKDLVKHQEYGVALELICQQLYEFEITVDSILFEQIVELTIMMQMPSSTCDFLRTT